MRSLAFLVIFFFAQIAHAAGNPVLLIGSPANPFTSYYSEILRNEGLNLFDYSEIGSVTPASLTGYDVVVLGEMPLTGAQVNMFVNWVSGGGNLIAMRPDKQLATLFGLTVTPGTLAEGYILIDQSRMPGLVNETIQFHGTADLYTLSGATALATLYSAATVATPSPAVTVRSVGTGTAVAFLYDLARSVVLTRQGNPAWAGQERDGLAPIRSDDLFFGPAAGDPKPDWVDRSKVRIPQADEQQRLLANLLIQVNLPRKPLPRFWYFPNGKPAAVVLTGDDHGNNGTSGRFDSHIAESPSGCSVANWECIRSTSYIFSNTPISPAAAAAYQADGFEIGLHVNTNCGDYTPASLPPLYSSQLALFASTFPSLSAPTTNRTHCIVWSDWATQAEVELNHGIRLDTNYYYWPPNWVNDSPGFMTGSGMPMRFARTNGSAIDVYQAATQMTDESGQTYPLTVDTLLDNAIGPLGYYGAFTANIHTDSATNQTQVWSNQIVASAKARGVPVISARQLLTWVDGRNGSAFSNSQWAGSTLSFTATVGTGAIGLQGLLPVSAANGTLTSILLNGNPVPVVLKTIKGILYASFAVAPGNYTASYNGPPITVSISPSAVALGQSDTTQFSALVLGTANSAVVWSISPNIGTISSTGLYTAPASITATQDVTVIATSAADPSKSGQATVTLVFGSGGIAVRDTTVADFAQGTGVGTYISQSGDGEVIVAPLLATEFEGTALPSEWTAFPWVASGAVTVAGGAATLDAARLDGPLYAAGRSLEFAATFSSDAFQHGGFGIDMNGPPWAIFSTGNGGALYARTNNAGLVQDTLLPGSWLNSRHTFRIEWTATNAIFSIDGTQVASHPFVFGGDLRPLFSDLNLGAGSLVVDWVRISPYGLSGTFTSRILDGGSSVLWGSMSWNAQVPSGTSLAIRLRTGDTPSPDPTWTPFSVVPSSGSTIGVVSRYAQYDVQFAATDPTRTASLNEVTLGAVTQSAAVTNLTHQSATVVWTTLAASDSQVEYGLTAAYGQSTVLDPTLVTNHTVNLSGLQPATLYHFRVKSRDAGGVLFTSEDFTFTTKPIPAPPIITGVLATPTSDGAIVSWSTNKPANSRVDFGSSAAPLPLTAVNTSLVTVHSVTLTALPIGNYFYRVTSCDDTGACSTSPIGSNPPGNFTVSDITPPLISNVSVAPLGNSAAVTWTTDEPASSRIDYGTSPASLTSTVSSAGLTTSHSLNLTGLQPGTNYHFRVMSADASGNTATNPVTSNPPGSFSTVAISVPVVSVVTAVPGIQGIATIRWSTNSATNSRVDYGTNPAELSSNVTDATLTNAHVVTLSGLTPGTLYYYRVTSADAFGATATFPAAPEPALSFVENAFSVWDASVIPAVASNSDTAGVELGMKFQSDIAGFVSGITFYKGPQNTGTHIGNLWSSAGTLLSTVTFSNESATGWQQATFASPVAITPNTTYIVSYYAPNGGYSTNTTFFASSGVNRPPLRALANGVDGGNGVYRYGTTSGYPSSTFNSTNYWVDVVFVDRIPPAISAISAVPGGTSATINWTSSEPSVARVDYGTSPANLNLSASVPTPATAHSVVLSGLLPQTTYHYRVTSTDPSLNSATQPLSPAAPLTFTTVMPIPPVISAVTVTPDTTTAVIAWNTDVPSTARIDYGTSPASLGSNVSNPALVTNHSLTVTGLAPGTTYYYRVSSANGVGDTATVPATLDPPATFSTLVPTAPVISTVTAIPGIQGIATIRWTTDKPSNSRVDYGTAPASLGLNVIDSAMTTSHSVTLTGLIPGTIYHYRVTSVDAIAMSSTFPPTPNTPLSFVENAFSIWDGAATPTVISDPDTGGVELGVKFQSDVAGLVSGIAFYKGAQNTGTHIGNLWTSAGVLLGSVTFSNESASGWQQATFANPVAIAPNTTYVVSYYAPNGRYSADTAFFASSGVTRPPLRALANGVDGPNGVYRYGPTSGFPNSTFNSANYWVDVIFVDRTPPVISSVNATAGGASATINWTSSEPSAARVDYGTSPAVLNLNAVVPAFTTANSVVLTGLAPQTTYHYRVTSTDPSQNSSTHPLSPAAPLSFTTATPMFPVISAITVTPGATSAIITWTTDINSNSRVDYGIAADALTLSTSSATQTTSHSVTLIGLSPSTTYHFRVTSSTAGGDSTTSPVAPTVPLSFVTTLGSGQGPGSPPSEWDVSGAGDPTIQGFTTDISYNLGETVRFKVNTDATAYRLDIYRMGYYNGDGALKVATIAPSVSLPQVQPNCLTVAATGLIDCGNWAESATWTIPANAKSGIYFAKAVRESGAAGSSHIVFVVRDDSRNSDILFQTSDTTWQAYNQYGGNSLYVGAPAGRAYKVSYNRPFTTRGTSPEDWVFNAEYPMVRWLEANGYDVTYTTGVDSDRRGALLLNHKVFMSVGHDEYWSGGQRTSIEAARNAGVNLAFFSSNEAFWKTRWEASIAGPLADYRTLVCYKETHANAKIDPTPTWTGTWRDTRAFNPEGGRPENAVTGTIFTVNCCTAGLSVPEDDGKMRFWRNTSIASLTPGQTAALPDGTLGYEWDEDLDNGSRPAGLIRLSTTTVNVPQKLTDFGSTYGPGTATHSATLYKHSSGALVFGSGTLQWSWGLDGTHDRGSAPPDPRMEQATVNLLADMGVQPTNLRAGLIPAAASTDTVRPTSAFTAPAAGANLTVGVAVNITGTAADTGGGVVGGVEISLDGGTTWRRATGRGTWSFAWTPATTGSVTLMARATDDSGNIQLPATSRSVTVGSGIAGPTISNLSVAPTGTTAVVTWTTSQSATARVDYGTSPTLLNLVVTRTSRLTSHSITLPSLNSGTTYYFRVTSVNQAGGSTTSPASTLPPSQFTTAHFPASTTIMTGTLLSGNAAALATDNNTYYQVRSTTSGIRTSSWYGAFAGVPKALTNLRVTYKGRNSQLVSESVSIWNWTTSQWVVLDTQVVSSTEITRSNLVPPGNAADYVSGSATTGEVRVRVQATGLLSTFTSLGDWMQILYNVP